MNLYLRHRAELIDYATPIVGDRALAEDVVQDAWLRFSEAGSHDSKTRLIRQPVGYLYRIVRNLALDISRRKIAENLADEARLPEVPDLAVDAGRAMEGREKLKALHRALAELPERERLVFDMHRMQGLTYAEIGVAMGLSQTRAYELVRAALEHCMMTLMDGGHL
ncbi:sigma-70 family RNA polymerase sigma factor [Novosphingobium indicum]|uniref:sigma-70 family RNA polymerase sigma factor n=1 Tax=Novosphingobium indicum TaxID=462949 RepID=UPI001E3E77EF|nr:sigma-70 family RNA polymerase sigma factor [Novosphingobium indicum]